ncbi:MAG: 1-deoxy-D-xylulose-5-phosphate reductoisomerase [Candidatus Krumholzibacteriia bacterium]
MKKRILVLGSTGSVGRNVLEVVAHHAGRFAVVGLSTNRNIEVLEQQCSRYADARVAVCMPEASARVSSIPEMNARSTGEGRSGLINLIEETEPDLVVNCLVGFAGLEPTLASLQRGTPVAIANKEAIVTGGELIREASRQSGAEVIPIDSEHVAISQCLCGSTIDDVSTVYITASGGALRDRPLETMADAAPEDVLAHPTWDMGNKITVDSATLVNKGLEVIEAHWLFDLPLDKIRVVIHPQSIVHSLVEFKDNSILAQMGIPDMRMPILYALTYPEKVDTPLPKSRIADFPDLSFGEVDVERYPCLDLVLRAARKGGNMPAVLNSANEVAVGAFLAKNVRFSEIYTIIEAAMDHVPQGRIRCFDDVFETDGRTRAYIREKFGL